MDWRLENQMNTENIAAEVVRGLRQTTAWRHLSEVDDAALHKLCISCAVDHASNLFYQVSKGNNAYLHLFGDDSLEKCIDLTLNIAIQIVCSEEVIKRSIELVKVELDKV